MVLIRTVSHRVGPCDFPPQRWTLEFISCVRCLWTQATPISGDTSAVRPMPHKLTLDNTHSTPKLAQRPANFLYQMPPSTALSPYQSYRTRGNRGVTGNMPALQRFVCGQPRCCLTHPHISLYSNGLVVAALEVGGTNTPR